MTAKRSLLTPGATRLARRTWRMSVAGLGAAAALAACGSSTPTSTPAKASASANSGSCAGVAGAHHARVVVEASPSSVVQRCVGFSTPTLSATKALADAHVTLGTQKYSFGLAICQVNGVPAHYSQCLPSGKPYWAMFLSRNGAAWATASAGISSTTLSPGDSLGLRYDSPTGTAAPPPAPTPA